MLTIALILCGYSIVSTFILAISHFRPGNYPEQAQARYFGRYLVLSLAGLQFFHYIYLQSGHFYSYEWVYQICLFSVAPAFYLYSKPLLKGYFPFKRTDLLHALPVIIAPLMSLSFAAPLAFTLGAGYIVWLSLSLYTLKEQRNRFHVEIIILGVIFLIAITVLIMGLSLPIFEHTLFLSLYSMAIGSAFILINLVINLAPRLPSKISEAAAEAYALTTLSKVNCVEALDKLNNLMTNDSLYENHNLDLATLAKLIGLSTHQLSELINTHLGLGFSRYIREQRINAAKTMLLAERSASVLSVGMSVGFTSQSNFYDAFREITGMTPGHYRKTVSTIYPE